MQTQAKTKLERHLYAPDPYGPGFYRGEQGGIYEVKALETLYPAWRFKSEIEDNGVIIVTERPPKNVYEFFFFEPEGDWGPFEGPQENLGFAKSDYEGIIREKENRPEHCLLYLGFDLQAPFDKPLTYHQLIGIFSFFGGLEQYVKTEEVREYSADGWEIDEINILVFTRKSDYPTLFKL